MALSTYIPRAEYVGLGNLADYDFDFKITSADQLRVVVSDDDFTEVFNVKGDDVVDLAGVTFDAVKGGGTVTLASNLPNTYHLAIILDEEQPKQPSEFNAKGSATLPRLEAAYDRLGSQIQRLTYIAKRSLRIPDTILDSEDFDNIIPQKTTDIAIQDNSDKILTIGSDNASIGIANYTVPQIIAMIDDLQTQIDALQAEIDALPSGGGGGGLPNGGATGEFLEKLSSTDGDADWKNADYSGFSSHFGAVPTLNGLKATLDWIMGITAQSPLISLAMAGGSGTIREKGTVVASSLMTATVTKRTDPIVNVRFYQGASLLATQTGNPPVPAGGIDTYNYAVPFSDTISFSAQTVDDGASNGGTPQNATSNTVTWTFVYPYYWGCEVQALADASIPTNLTKVLASSQKPSSLTFTAPGGQVFYVVIPVAAGAYSSIKDVLGFETITDWTRTTISITGLDATPQNYYRYEFNNIVTAGSFPYTFS